MVGLKYKVVVVFESEVGEGVGWFFGDCGWIIYRGEV